MRPQRLSVVRDGALNGEATELANREEHGKLRGWLNSRRAMALAQGLSGEMMVILEAESSEVWGSRAIDRRSRVGKALEQWRADLVADLGGKGQ